MVRAFCLLIALVFVSGAASAENRFRPHNSADERACGADAKRFCKAEIPDQFRVASCLQEHRERISHACRAALTGHGL